MVLKSLDQSVRLVRTAAKALEHMAEAELRCEHPSSISERIEAIQTIAARLSDLGGEIEDEAERLNAHGAQLHR